MSTSIMDDFSSCSIKDEFHQENLEDLNMRRSVSLSDEQSDDQLNADEGIEMRSTRSNSWSSGNSQHSPKINTRSAFSSNKHGSQGRYKTELCRPFMETGSCKYGEKCQFAHGQEDIRGLPRHPKYKTEMCRTFHTTGFCPYGPRCHFIHSEDPAKLMLINDMKQKQMVQQILTYLKQQNIFPVKPFATVPVKQYATVPVIATPVIPVNVIPIDASIAYPYAINISTGRVGGIGGGGHPRPDSLGSDGSPSTSPIGSPDLTLNKLSFPRFQPQVSTNSGVPHTTSRMKFLKLDRRLPVFSNMAISAE